MSESRNHGTRNLPANIRTSVRKRTQLAARSALIEVVDLRQLVNRVVAAHNQSAIELHALKDIVMESAHAHPERNVLLIGSVGASAPVGIEKDEFERRVAAVKARMVAEAAQAAQAATAQGVDVSNGAPKPPSGATGLGISGNDQSPATDDARKVA